MKSDEIWFKKAVIYELHVRSFNDSNADGIGDFKGLQQRLSYFQELGVTALWLLPFYPSPLRDDGYDIADYYDVNPDYGTLQDFKDFLDEAHSRGLRVITELVINHTSDQNPLFQRARHAPAGSPERDFFVWSDTPQRFQEARIIFKDFETSNWAWDPVANAYYWHRFYSHQPDLNFDNPAVQQEVFKVLDYWLEMGVDGLRLDAVPYLFEREGTSCENLPETHDFLKKLRTHVDEKYPGRMLLAEANQWPEDAAAYFGDGDECHMEFHFPLMPRLFMAIQQEDRYPIIDILDQTPQIPDNCQWAIFLRNHDELTLEMVTDEERDYMVRMYARDARARINLGIRRRLAPLLGNSRRKIELINSLLLSLPGTPIIYYGDEIGMGDNFYLGDRHGVRTPMQWSADRNAGFSRSNPQQLFLPVIIDPEFHYETVNVDMQQKNLSSLFWWMRRILKIRQQFPAFSVGTIEFLTGGNARVLSFLRKDEKSTLLVVANLSRFTQATSLDLSSYEGHIPREIFGSSMLPEITTAPYLFTLGPHSFYWFHLTAPDHAIVPEAQTPELHGKAEWGEMLQREIEQIILPSYLPGARWFGGKQRAIRDIKLSEIIPFLETYRILIIEVSFSEGSASVYLMAMKIATESPVHTRDIIAHFSNGALLLDATSEPEFQSGLLRFMQQGQRLKGESYQISSRGCHTEVNADAVHALSAEQSNSSFVFDNAVALKLFRKIESGPNPDADVLRALGETTFNNVPRYLGELLFTAQGETSVLALATEFVQAQGDGWSFTLDAVERYFERVMAACEASPDEHFEELFGANYSERAWQLGIRTGELHAALNSIQAPSFQPEPFSTMYQRSLYQSLRSHARRTEAELHSKLSSLKNETRTLADTLLAQIEPLMNIYEMLLKRKLSAAKIRIHGDYHLGQVLNTGKDFVILDFEGEPKRSIGERLLKKSPLVDVAGMMRSFNYAVESALSHQTASDREKLAPWADRWNQEVNKRFLLGYHQALEEKGFQPVGKEDMSFLLQIFLIDKALYEVGYELSYRPDLVAIPLRAAGELIREARALGQ